MMNASLETDILKGVSRSFYLSLRFLPVPMRRPAVIAYLLARTTDTIADSASVPHTERMERLTVILEDLRHGRTDAEIPAGLISSTPLIRERQLLESYSRLMEALVSLSIAEIGLIHEVLKIIVSGQILDLERFGTRTGEEIRTLANPQRLEDYTWRVAGSVGEFWTKLGYLTLREKFSREDPAILLTHAAKYGQGLQLVNILRDLPEDLAQGRCYLPVKNPKDEQELMESFSAWRQQANVWVKHGRQYSAALGTARLKISSALPAMIAMETLEQIEGASFSQLSERIKIPRKRVYRLIWQAWLESLKASGGSYVS
ncbi:phytoene/squalene synthase family protein [Luteolibacter algae]